MIFDFVNVKTGAIYTAIESGLFMYDIGQQGFYIETMHLFDMDKLFEDGTWKRLA